MGSFETFLNANWVSIVAFICGAALTLFIYKLQKNEPYPVYTASTLRIIGNSNIFEEGELKITYQGNEVDKIAKTIISFWNKGKKAIRGTDLVDEDKIRISFEPGTKILKAKVISITNSSNRFVVEDISGNDIILYFHYLNKNDGATIEILHDSCERFPVMKGSIIGYQREIKEIENDAYLTFISTTSLKAIRHFGITLIGSVLITSIIISLLYDTINIPVASIVTVFILLASYYVSILRYKKKNSLKNYKRIHRISHSVLRLKWGMP